VAVIEAPVAPLLVVAGAGSGKTETMAGRLVWLVANGHVQAEQVLGLTFTRKAAGELADRVRSRLRALSRRGLVAESSAVTVSTYHAYAATVLADHGLRIGVEPGVRLLGEAGAWQLVDDIVERWDGDMTDVQAARRTVVDAVLALAGECAEHLVDADDLDAALAGVLDLVLALPAEVGQSAPGVPKGALKEVLQRLERPPPAGPDRARVRPAQARVRGDRLRRPGRAGRPDRRSGARGRCLASASGTASSCWTSTRTPAMRS
jgi:DNA helicase-2/ATP-dependent DNA helicase PcrA